jgi:hypothetical protein
MGPNPTTGLNIAARVVITSSAPTLVLIGASQLLTYQITAQVTDVDGNVLGSQPELYYNIVAGNDVAEVDDSGLVTATAAGQVVVQVSAAAFGNTINLFTVDGIPINAIYAEQTVQVTPGVPVTPDFSFTLDSATIHIGTTGIATLTITQTAHAGFSGTTTFRILGIAESSVLLWGGDGNGHPLTITGSGTLVIRFITTGAAAQSIPFRVWGLANPQAVNTGDLFGDSVRGLNHTTPATLVIS